MATAWNAWPTPPMSRSPSKYSRSPTSGLSVSPSVDRSCVLSARLAAAVPQDTRRQLPALPPEILRRIIRTALALDPSIPEPIPLDFPARSALPSAIPSPAVTDSFPSSTLSPPSAFRQPFYAPTFPGFGFDDDEDEKHDKQIPVSWDALAGHGARRATRLRAAQKADVTRAARTMMGVCKAWKFIVLKYLYADPTVTEVNIAALGRAVIQGDRKWSDLNLHPHSIPGRWITVLDLTHVNPICGFPGHDALAVSRAITSLLDLTPALKHLRLPPGGFKLSELEHAPCVRQLRALEGVRLTGLTSEEEVLRLLGVTRSLELLALEWVGGRRAATGEDGDEEMLDSDSLPAPPDLHRLNALTLVAAQPGLLLAALTRADLPHLTRLVMSPYEPGLIAWEEDAVRGGPRALQLEHGHKIRSLTYTSSGGWPPRDTMPPSDTLTLHPNLAHLHLALPHAVLNDNPDFARSLADRLHPLAAVTLPRWPRVVQADASPSPHPVGAPGAPPTPPVENSQWPAGNKFLAALLSRPSRLRTVRVDGFNWVASSLGRWAAESGDSGMMRQWAVAMSRVHIDLRDMDGASPPVIERGRPTVGRRSIDGGSRRSVDMPHAPGAMRRSIDQGRRPSFVRRNTDDDENDGG